MLDFENTKKLMQFPIGFNDFYDVIISQILVLDLLMLVNKAWSMVQRIEIHLHIQHTYPTESTAMLVDILLNLTSHVQGGMISMVKLLWFQTD